MGTGGVGWLELPGFSLIELLIRGRYDKYQCNEIDVAAKMKGRNPSDNCTIYPQPEAEGSCYRNTFGEWECSMTDIAIGLGTAQHYQPAPK